MFFESKWGNLVGTLAKSRSFSKYLRFVHAGTQGSSVDISRQIVGYSYGCRFSYAEQDQINLSNLISFGFPNSSWSVTERGIVSSFKIIGSKKELLKTAALKYSGFILTQCPTNKPPALTPLATKRFGWVIFSEIKNSAHERQSKKLLGFFSSLPSRCH